MQFIPDKYTSSTQVYVDTESLLRPLLSGLAVNRDVMSQVGMMQAVMLSRPNLEKVAQKTDLMLDAKTRQEQEAIIDSLAQAHQAGAPGWPGNAQHVPGVVRRQRSRRSRIAWCARCSTRSWKTAWA